MQSSSNDPAVSVLMSVYNGQNFLRQAVDSILGQTFADFEFIIIDDGSTDATPDILAGYTDSRIRRVRNPGNIGLTRSLNIGLEMARGRYVARMDADDESLPTRIEEQVAFLDANPGVAVCGTAALVNGRPVSRPGEDAVIRSLLPFSPCLTHGSVMLRAAVLREHGLRYNEAFARAQDYELWYRLSRIPGAGFANLRTPLLSYRLHTGQVSSTEGEEQSASGDAVRRAFLAHMGIEPSDLDLETHRDLFKGNDSPRTRQRLASWAARLVRANRASGTCPPDAFEFCIGRMVWNFWRDSARTPPLSLLWLLARRPAYAHGRLIRAMGEKYIWLGWLRYFRRRA